MTTKKVKSSIPEVDLATVEADRAANDGTTVDPSSVPQPFPQPSGDDMVHVGVVGSDEIIDPTDTTRLEALLNKSADAMASRSAEATDTTPTEDDYVKVFYHSHTRRYVQFNQALIGRSDFQQRRILKTEFHKLGVSA